MNYSHKPGLTFYMLLILCFGSAAAGVARADTVTFTGTRTNQTPGAAPGGRCAPRLTVNINPRPGTADFSTGTSNFGTFTSIQSQCITPPIPAPFDNGLFTWTFAGGDTLTGTTFGALTGIFNPTITSVLNTMENYTITGGTGIFAGATGNILGLGTVTFTPGSFPLANLSLNGTITAPGLTAVPEPTTMVLLGTGLAAIVAKVRRRRKTHGDDQEA